jgi:hypothetical protein
MSLKIEGCPTDEARTTSFIPSPRQKIKIKRALATGETAGVIIFIEENGFFERREKRRLSMQFKGWHLISFG